MIVFMTTANISSYALNSSNDIFYTLQGGKKNSNTVNAIRDGINNFGKVAKQSVVNSSPNPVAPSVILDISGTAQTALKG